MTHRKDEQQTEWNQLHGSLKNIMQQELSLTRELLANFHQEELSLMLQDQGSWTQIMQQRAQMIERLSTLRLQRQQTTEQIIPLAEKKGTTATLDEILPLNEEITYEIFNLRDQLLALTERINRQQSRNQHLREMPEPLHFMPPSPTALPQPPRAKRKASVATYNIKK
ncbi:MAG: hypothetical protein K2P51_07120 [Rhabdochlamydiaceae bacterium]|nr:hypothetical protein [Rhabdochlamydiaceae bacterium]